jgi:hypothetical protein
MSSSADWLFDVLTPLDFQVHVTRPYWNLIVTTKHPAMAGRERDVEAALRAPVEIRVSRIDPSVHLFYKIERPGRWVCAVAK